ncbi:MAG: CIA30 family protein [Bacteroidota bacterium]
MKLISSLLIVIWGLTLNLLSAQDLLLENATVLDPQGQSAEKVHLWIKDGKIHRRLANSPANFEGQRLDLSGQYILPAFIDLHTHSWGNAGVGGQMEMLMTSGVAERMLYCGVTAFLDLFSEENSIFAVRDQQRKEGLVGADIYCAGPILTCDGGHGTEYGLPTRVINNPDEAVRVVKALVEERQPDVVKIVYDNAPNRLPTIDLPTLQAAINTAQNLKVKTVIHIGSWQDVIDALEAGASAITHLPAGKMPEEVPALFLKSKAVLIPTLTVEADLVELYDHPEILDSKLLTSAVNPLVINSYRDKANLDPRTAGFMHFQEHTAEHLGGSLKALYEAGVTIYNGTDGGNPGVFQGYSVHREMILMSEMGMSNWDILAASSTAAADFLALDYGVSEGDLANLVILQADPTQDIRHTQMISAVIQHGQLVDRKALAYQESRSTQWSEKTISDFSEAKQNWQALSDQIQGGASSVETNIADGIFKMKGKLQTTQRMPFGWVLISHDFDSNRQPVNISAFEGIKIRYKLNKGNMYVSLSDERITNFDYHAFVLEGGEGWQEVQIPFSEMGQTFSRPAMEWLGEKIIAINFGASGAQPMEFEMEVDWVVFY